MRNGHGSIGHVTCFGCLGILLAWPQHGAADQPDLLTVVREGHRAARQSIQSFSATVANKFTNSKHRVLTQTAEYWRSFDTVHIRRTDGGGTADTLLKEGEIRQVIRAVGPGTQREQIDYIAYRKAAVETLSLCDAWERMRIDFAGPDGRRCDLDHFLEFAERPPQASREKKDGHDCVRLTLSLVTTAGLVDHITLWHDVDHNYLVWKMLVTNDKHPSDRYEIEILEFVEPVPGVFVPTKCHRDSYHDSELGSREEITLTDIKVNQPISASDFALPAIPAGTMLNDRIRGTRYPINENWDPIGPASPLRELSVPGGSKGSRSDSHSQSTSEAKPLSRLLVPASLLVLVIACAGLIYRHYRRDGGLRRVR